MKRNILKILLIGILFIINTFNMTTFATLQDIDTHWAGETIKEFIDKEYLKNSGDKFNPDEYIKKGEFTIIVNRFFSYGTLETPEENLKLAENKGYLFNSNVEDTITREEASVAICKILAVSTEQNVMTDFADDSQISMWSKGYIYKLQKEGIILGYPDNTFKPQKNMTKAEFVTLLNRCVGIGGNDLEIIEKDIRGVELGIFDYTDGQVAVIPIVDEIKINSGDIINLAVMFSDEINEDDIVTEVDNAEIVHVDEEQYLLTGLKKGKTEVTFKTKDEIYEFSFLVNVK